MTEKALFQGMSTEDRIKALEGLAVKTENQRVRREYSADEKDQMKDFVSQESIGIMDATEEFKKIQKEFNTATKKNKDAVIDALKGIKRGYSENEERVFLVDDQDNGVMNIYDYKGLLITSRPLYANERQTRTIELKTGTND